VFDLPSLLDTLVGEGDATALIRSGVFSGKVCRRFVTGGSTTNEDFRGVVWRREREELGRVER